MRSGNTRIRLVISLLLMVGLLALTSCSISKSLSSPSRWSGKSSKSSSSPSRSSSRSSEDEEGSEAPADAETPAPAKEEARYFEDIRDYTATSVAAESTPASLADGLGPVARSHGITDWESDPTALRAIGAGAAQAGLTPDQLAPYKEAMGNGELTRIQLIQEGYDGAGELTSLRR